MMTLANHRLDDGAHCVVSLQLPVHFDELKLVPPPDPTVTHGTEHSPFERARVPPGNARPQGRGFFLRAVPYIFSLLLSRSPWRGR
jgi:hypothetical protein